MANCVNHKTVNAIYRCSTCGSPICYECLQKYKRPHRSKRIGFCSEECLEKYMEGQTENKKKAKRSLLIGIAILCVSAFYYWLVPGRGYWEQIKDLDYTSFSVILPLLVAVYGELFSRRSYGFLGILLGFWYIGKAYDLYRHGEDARIYDYHKEQDGYRHNIYKCSKELEPQEKARVLDKLGKSTPYYLMLPRGGYNAVIRHLENFLELFGGSNEYKTSLKHIYIGLTSGAEVYLFFKENVDHYYFFNLLSSMAGISEAEGYVTFEGRQYMFKDAGSGDSICGVESTGECIEVSLVDGSFKHIKEKCIPYSEPEPGYVGVVKLYDAKIYLNSLEDLHKLERRHCA